MGEALQIGFFVLAFIVLAAQLQHLEINHAATQGQRSEP